MIWDRIGRKSRNFSANRWAQPKDGGFAALFAVKLCFTGTEGFEKPRLRRRVDLPLSRIEVKLDGLEDADGEAKQRAKKLDRAEVLTGYGHDE